MQTLRHRIEKLECEGSASDSPLLRLYVMPPGFRLSEDLHEGGRWSSWSAAT